MTTIRRRLTYWYTVALGVTVLAFGSLLGGVAEARSLIGQMVCGVATSVPVVVITDRHVGECVHMGSRVGGRHEVFSHVAEADLVWGTPRLCPLGADSRGRTEVQHLEGRMPGEERHPREP